MCVCGGGGSKSWWERCTEQCFPLPVDNSRGCEDVLYTYVGHQDGLGSAGQECWWKQATSWGNCLSTQGLHSSSFMTTAAVFTTVWSVLLPVLSVCTSFGRSICLPLLSACPSVCLFGTLVHCVKTPKCVIYRFSLSSSSLSASSTSNTLVEFWGLNTDEY